MAVRSLTAEEIDSVLAQERLVRVAFSDGEELYVVTLGYVWHNRTLYGVSAEGRKSKLAAVRPKVAFQLDSTIRTGPFGWFSVAGEGTFEWVSDLSQARLVAASLQPQFADAPLWWQEEQSQRFAAGLLRYWRIIPSSLSGRHDEPPSDA